MVSILAYAVIMVHLVMAVFLFIQSRKGDVQKGIRLRYFPFMFVLSSMMVVCNLLCGDSVSVRLCSDILVSILAMVIVLSSLCPETYQKNLLCSVAVMAVIRCVYYLLGAVGIVCLWDNCYSLLSSCVLYHLIAIFFFWTIWNRLREVKAVMRSGTVWSFLSLCVDSIYIMAPSLVIMMMTVFILIFPSSFNLVAAVAVLILLLELLALYMRMISQTQFVFMLSHENVIVESMKISQMEMLNSNPQTDEQYREIYERIIVYFEINKPFLNGDLTINDIVKDVYSNKVYISKAISHYTGRNFRQFVNYHRVMYSMDLFRTDPMLRVAQLAEKSGFNSVVSYTMAFRLFMNETPSDWCRKEKTKLIKTKK